MSRIYFHFGKSMEAIMYTNWSVILNTGHVNYLAKRWAGHSKWQNIKSTKEHFDQMKSMKFSKMSRLIIMSVKKHGEDVSANSELRNLLEDAKKINMPKVTIQKAIASAKNKGSAKPYWTVFSGPKGLLLGLEVMFANSNPNFLRSKLAQTKKLNLKMETHPRNVCNEKGIIITEFLENSEKSLEKALEDGIEIGVNEVYENDNDSLIFECLPERVDSLCDQLSKRGYNILSASTELEFNSTVDLNEDEIQEIENLISKLQIQNEEIIRACYNSTVQ